MSVALDQYRLGCRRLASRYALIGGIAASLLPVESTRVATIGLAVQQARLVALVNPTWIVAAEVSLVATLIHHNLNHLIFGHHLLPSEHYPDRKAFELTVELCANEYLPGPFPR